MQYTFYQLPHHGGIPISITTMGTYLWHKCMSMFTKNLRPHNDNIIILYYVVSWQRSSAPSSFTFAATFSLYWPLQPHPGSSNSTHEGREHIRREGLEEHFTWWPKRSGEWEDLDGGHEISHFDHQILRCVFIIKYIFSLFTFHCFIIIYICIV